MVMQDRKTLSLWSSMTGECFRGDLEGKTLEPYPFVMTTWASWLESYPDTQVLLKPEEARGDSTPYAKYFEDPDRLGIFGRGIEDHRLPPKETVLAVKVQGSSKVYSYKDLKGRQLIQDSINGTPIVLVSTAGGYVAYIREAGGRELDLSYDDGHMVHGSEKWDAATGGGTVALKSIRAHTTFWFGWVSFFPETEIWVP